MVGRKEGRMEDSKKSKNGWQYECIACSLYFLLDTVHLKNRWYSTYCTQCMHGKVCVWEKKLREYIL